MLDIFASFRKMLTAQKGELVRVELTLLNSNERELVQLRKQHNVSNFLGKPPYCIHSLSIGIFLNAYYIFYRTFKQY